MGGADGYMTISQTRKQFADAALVILHAAFHLEPFLQIDAPPAHKLSLLGIRPRLHHPAELFAGAFIY